MTDEVLGVEPADQSLELADFLHVLQVELFFLFILNLTFTGKLTRMVLLLFSLQLEWQFHYFRLKLHNVLLLVKKINKTEVPLFLCVQGRRQPNTPPVVDHGSRYLLRLFFI